MPWKQKIDDLLYQLLIVICRLPDACNAHLGIASLLEALEQAEQAPHIVLVHLQVGSAHTRCQQVRRYEIDMKTERLQFAITTWSNQLGS